MPIDSVYINNFKSIRDSGNIKILSLNVLIGPNGVGKSNFISFFKLLNSISDKRLPAYVANNGYADKILHYGKKKSKELSGGIVFKIRDGNTNNSYNFVLKPDPANGFYFEKELVGYNIFSQGYNENWDHKPLDSTGEKNSGLHNHSSSRIEYLKKSFGAFQVFHFHDTSNTAPLKQAAKLRDNATLREDGSNLAAFLYKISKKHPLNFKLIEYAIRSIAPFFDRFDLHPDNLNSDLIFLKWLEKGSDEYFDASNLSDGSIRFIALAALLLQPNPPETIIIDEPELGLHPSAINKLAAIIKSTSLKSQIILSTQSINLLDQFSTEDIIVVDRKDNQSTFRRLEKSALENWIEQYSIGELWSKNVIGGTP